MPSGSVHTITTIALAVGTVATGQPTAATVGVLSGLILSPDLDVDKGFIGLAHLRRVPVIGWLLAVAWRVFWYPYAKIVPHRSPISHAPIVGTLLRVGYLAVPVLAINYAGVGMALPAGFGLWLAWLAVADGLHIILDWTVKNE